MKIAITADVHLTSRNKNPERFNALEYVLKKSLVEHAGALIIAGDLFDKSCVDPGELEKLLGKPEFVDLPIYIIPGNHDPMVTEGMFVAKNIHFITKPELIELDGKQKFLFIPYRRRSAIGPLIAEGKYTLVPDQWVLIGHGDWLETNTPVNNYEDDQYMPLSRGDVQQSKPRKVFLGHIHATYDSEFVYYPGSPCPLDPTEIGFHTFLLYDFESDKIERITIDNDVIYQKILLTIVPVENESELIYSSLDEQIAKWGISTDLFPKTKVRVEVQGYSSNRDTIQKTIEKTLKSRNLCLESPIDLTNLKISNDQMRADIALETKKQILELDLQESADEPRIDDYLAEALNIIYKG